MGVAPLVGGTATIDASTGLLTATGVGTVTVTVTAVANDGSVAQGTKVITVQATATSPTAVNLGTAGNYAILAETGISTVPNSVITGDIGIGPVAATYFTGFGMTLDATGAFSTSTQVTGKAYAPDYEFLQPLAILQQQ